MKYSKCQKMALFSEKKSYQYHFVNFFFFFFKESINKGLLFIKCIAITRKIRKFMVFLKCIPTYKRRGDIIICPVCAAIAI